MPRRLQLETAKLERQRARGSLVLLVQAKLRELLQANSRVKTADPPSPGLRRASWRPPLLGLQVLQQDCRLLQAPEIPPARVRARQC